jgi:hypothetical protein
MQGIEARREVGTSLMFIGLALWVADLLVFFFLPAAVKLGSQTVFMGIIVALAIAGLVFMASGYLARGKFGEE